MAPFYDIGDKKEGYLKDECICRNGNYSEIIADHPLTLMLEYHKHDLLNHDLIQSYITTKWNTFAKWFYYPRRTSFFLNFALQLTFSLCIPLAVCSASDWNNYQH